MEYELKLITQAGIPEAASKAELYRYLNDPEEAESICRDILAVDPTNQAALRVLGLSITDQFIGIGMDRYRQAEETFQKLTDRYERAYYLGLLYERRAKAQVHSGQPPHTLLPLFDRALAQFEEAQQISPAGNDDAILRWNRCVRLLETLKQRIEENMAAMSSKGIPSISA